MDLTQHEKSILKKQKYDILRYYKREVARLQNRIDYLEGKEFYEEIKKQVLNSASQSKG